MLYLLNCPILTSFGNFSYTKINNPVDIVKFHKGFVSAIGHKSTAGLLTKLLGIEVPVNRIQARMEPGDWALVFQLGTRLPEGTVLDDAALQNLDYSFGLLIHLH
jgi:hypothetical protein